LKFYFLHRENYSKYIVLELRTFVLKNRVSTFWYTFLSILQRNGEKKKVKLLGYTK